MDSARILVVEDDAAINDVVCKRLAKDGHELVSAFSGTEARMLLESDSSFDLVICDLMLPGMKGEEVVSRLRSLSDSTPIIVISARDAVSDKIDLLALGADDYLTKPFDLDELSARVAVQLRHAAAHAGRSSGEANMPAAEKGVLRCGEWMIDRVGRTFTAAGESVELTRTEFEILELLATHPKQVFSKQALYEHVWGECFAGQESTISAHVSNLRVKLKPSGTDAYIQTVWGIGFRLVLSDSCEA